MKKRLVTFVSLVLTLFVAIGTLCGCNLVTTNVERDMNQIVADINIKGDYKGETEHIVKKDMLIAYMNYGYYYVQQGQIEANAMFETIIDNLINQRILIQNAKAEVNKEKGLNVSDWDAVNFVTDESNRLEAEYNAVNSIDSLVKSYIEKEQKLQDKSDIESRSVPNGATNYVEKIDFSKKEDVKALIKNLKDNMKGQVGDDRNIAYYKVLNLLDVNGLLGEDYETGDIFSTYYYDYLLKSNYESFIVLEYEQIILDKTNINKLTYEALEEVFKDKYNAQEKKYKDDIDTYKTDLGSASSASPIFYASSDAEEKIGLVWNLLVGVSDEQKEAIAKIDKKNKSIDDIKAEREEILKGLVMKDQRSSWVYSGYDAIFDNDLNTTGKGTLNFVNDYSFTDKGIAFQGEVEWLNKNGYTQVYEKNFEDKYVIRYKDADGNVDEDYTPELRVNSLTEVEETNIESNLTGFINSLTGDFEDKIKDLIFAFSTDSGSLSSLDGYVLMKDDKNTSYVEEFQKDGETILSNVQGDSVLSKTDYGYHFMYLNKMAKDYESLSEYCLAVDGEGKTGEEYFDYLMKHWADLDEADTETYLYTFANTYMQNILNKYEKEIERIANADNEKVVRYESRYADLIKA